jgi:DNA-binding NtrC family response regulator
MIAHDWPGNVRELLNVLRRASLFADGHRIDGDLMRRMLAASVFAHSGAPARERAPQPARSAGSSVTSLADMERQHIEQVLDEMGGNVTRAASALGIDRRTLQRKLRGYGISGDE